MSPKVTLGSRAEHPEHPAGKEPPKSSSAPCKEVFLRSNCSPFPGTPLLPLERPLEQPGMIVPVSPEIFSGSVCGNQQQQPWRGHGRAAESYPGAPLDAPINPLLSKARREWERLRLAPLCPLTARLILGAFPVDEGWMSQPADRCRVSDVTAPSGNGATTKSSVGYGENGDPRGRIPVVPSLTQAGAHWPGQSLLLPTDVAASLGSSWSKAS